MMTMISTSCPNGSIGSVTSVARVAPIRQSAEIERSNTSGAFPSFRIVTAIVRLLPSAGAAIDEDSGVTVAD